MSLHNLLQKCLTVIKQLFIVNILKDMCFNITLGRLKAAIHIYGTDRCL